MLPLNTDSCEGSRGSALGGSLIKVLHITLDEYCFVLFQACENMMFMGYIVVDVTCSCADMYNNM